MQSRRFNHPILRGASASLLGLAALLAACEAKMPTAADVERMDAQSAETNAKALGLVHRDSAISWSVDGVETNEARAKLISKDSIVRLDVSKAPDGSAHIYVVTKAKQPLGAAREDSIRVNYRPSRRSQGRLGGRSLWRRSKQWRDRHYDETLARRGDLAVEVRESGTWLLPQLLRGSTSRGIGSDSLILTSTVHRAIFSPENIRGASCHRSRKNCCAERSTR